MPYHCIEPNEKVDAKFYASSDPTTEYSSSILIFKNGTIELSCIGSLPDKLSKIKRKPINNGFNQSHFYRQHSASTIFYPERKNPTKVTSIKTKFNFDAEIPQSDYIQGHCRFGYFILFAKHALSYTSKGGYYTYKGFEYGLFSKKITDKKNFYIYKLNLSFDHLASFVDDSKTEVVHLYDPESGLPTFTQIKHTVDKLPILQLEVKNYLAKVYSRVQIEKIGQYEEKGKSTAFQEV